jgi:hypothetical protein
MIFLNTDPRAKPVTVAARSKARNVFGSSNTGIVGSNPSRGMDVRLLLFCVCAVIFS